ncbi:MAG TPA: PQQ-binding-like beta-propeller repeat protein [Candidatus Eremiobacteraceae bacterium]
MCALIFLLSVASSSAIAGSGADARHHVVPTQVRLVHGPAFYQTTIGRQPTQDAAQSEDAVTYQITPTHTGAIDGPGTKLPLSIKWTAPLGQASTYPVMASGRVFVGGTNVFALNAANGATLWSKATPSIGLALDHNKLFNLSGGGQLAAFVPSTGVELWFNSLPGQYAFSSPPAAGNGMVYTGGAGSGGTVYAVNETNGNLVWTANVENGDDSSPVVTSTGVYVSYVCPQAYDFAPLTGALIWHYSGPCEGGGGATAVLYRGLLYTESWASNPPGLILRGTDGSPLGTFNSLVTPAFAKGLGYFVENSNQSLVAVSTRTGNVKWTQTLSGDSYSVPPIVITNTRSGDLVVCATAAGTLDVYDAKTGTPLQSLSLGSGAENGMAFSHGLLVVPSGNNVIGLK